CKSSYWKYVDDITISEVVPHGSLSTIQDDLDSITAWAEENCISLNPKKCTKCLNLCGIEVNSSKTDGMWIGSLKSNDEKPFGINWPSEPIKALGVFFTYDQ
ncbi:hypothetical protein pdam_00022839, partial [Pocillopora damicornis]